MMVAVRAALVTGEVVSQIIVAGSEVRALEVAISYKVQRFSDKQRNNTFQSCFDYPYTTRQSIVVQSQRDVPVYKATYKATCLSL